MGQTTGTRAEPVMADSVKRAKRDASCQPQRLKECQEEMKKENPLYGFTHMERPDDMNMTYRKTTLGTYVPVESVLSYQLTLTEGNFEVFHSTTEHSKYACADMVFTIRHYPETTNS